MRTALLAALLGSAALATGAAAQQQPQVTPTTVPQGTVDARAALAECERLAAYLEQAKPADAGVTVEQARAWQQAANALPCQDNLRRLTENDAAKAVQPRPQAAAESVAPVGAAGAAQVLVQQSQPTVTVRQAQPEIIVRQPPPLITVQQPQPEIIVRMPPPDVNVAMARPEVQVSMPQPQVQVVSPQAQPQPQIQSSSGQPNVRFERTGEPQVIYQPSEGQPQIRFEPQGQAASPQAQPAPTQQTAQAQLNTDQRAGTGTAAAAGAATGAAAQTGSIGSPGLQAVKASDLENMSLYNARGERMGDVEEVLTGADNKAYIVVSHGGFLGLGQKQVALPAEQIAMRGDRLIADTLTDEQIRALPEFKQNATYKEMDDNQTASLRLLQ